MMPQAIMIQNHISDKNTVRTYTTKEIADEIGIHVNTVRFYEKVGFLTKPERLQNGYRVYTELHLCECKLIRLAMRAEVLQNGLRKKAVEIIQCCALLDFDRAILLSDEYMKMIENETANALSAAASAERRLVAHSDNTSGLKRSEAAKSLRVTSETLRTWERSGLIKANRDKNGNRIYSDDNMIRLNVIRTLRCANYSISAILRLLNQSDGFGKKSASAILDTPEDSEDIVSVCDRLISSLKATASDAILIKEKLKEIKLKFSTIQ